YVIDDVTFTAKHEEVNVKKTADKTSVTKNEKVSYTVVVEIPTYSANATDKSFYVADLLPNGLTIDTDSIKVQINSTDVDTAAYTLDTTATAEYTFKLSVNTAKYVASWATEGGKELVITYTATLNDDDTTAVNDTETNTVTFDYSNYPYVADSHVQKTDTADVTTFAIKIDKFVKDEEANKLAGATFDLYRTATQAEIDAGTAVDIPHTTVKGIKLEGNLVTDDNGAATFAKYEANGTNYDYYLVETLAPTGYNILDNAVQVNFTDTDVAATDGVYTVKVPNSSGIKLPITGGMGTVIFTVAGILLMLGAVILFVVSRKKAKAE
ncbi:MAG: SpaH/EbpB family LPXTG-anchored major pilin, partial [Acutalibacteraceae bacterium]